MALESASSGAVALLASQLITTSFKQRTDTSSHHLGAATATSAAAATSPDLRCLDGLRAICSALVVAFHTLLVWRAGVPFETYAPLARGHWFVQAALTGGPIAVDLFLVITGLLAAYQLVPQLECSSRGGWRVACGYWRRRALRLLPAYLAVLALAPRGGPADGVPPEAALAHTMFFSQCPAGLWRNLLLVSNWNFLGACGLHLWSFSLQAQFYAAFPLLLLALRPRTPGFRARCAGALAGLFAGGTAWRLYRAWSVPLQLPYGDVSTSAGGLAYLSLLEATYFHTGIRVAQLALGAALGLLLRSPKALAWLSHRRGLVTACAASLQAAFLYTLSAWNPNGLPGEDTWSPTASRLYASLLYFGSPLLSSLAAATLLALFLRSDPLHSRIASALSAPVFSLPAKLSFCLYLVHERACLWLLMYLMPSGLPALAAVAPVSALAIHIAAALAAGYALAYMLHALVEKRFG